MCLQVACYDFVINDTYGDGMFGSQYASCNDDGDYYVITEFDDTLVAMPAVDFGFGTTHNFCVPSVDLADFTWGGAPGFCPAETVTFTDASVGATSWSWNFGANASPATATGAGPHNITYSTGGTSTVLLTINGGPLFSSQLITIYPQAVVPTISASGATAFCAGSSLDLTSSETGGNVWSNFATTDLITVTAAGSYSVTYTDSNGCAAASLPIAITVNALPVIAAGLVTDPATCASATGTIEITGSGTGDLTWIGSGTGIVSGVTLPHTLLGYTAGFYNVTYIDPNGCVSNSVSASLSDPTPPPTPAISLSSSITFCDGDSVVLTSSAASGNSWSTGETNQAITVFASGSYGVVVTSAGCSATSLPISVVVNSNPTDPAITANNSLTICDGDTVELSSSYTGGNVWSSLESTDMIIVTTSGTWDVTYTDGNGCSSTSTPTTVLVNPLPSVSAGLDQEVCAGALVTLSGAGASAYTWDNGVLNGIGFNPLVGTATYTVTGTDANGCVATDQMTVTAFEPPTVMMTLSLDTTCIAAGNVTLTGSPSGGTYTGIGVTGNQFDPSASGQGTFNVSYDYIDANSCTGTITLSIVVQDCSALADIEAMSALLIYPNPTTGGFAITLDGEFEYSMLDARGRVVAKGAGINEENIDASSYEAGVYMLTITTEFETRTVRLIRN